ncbi:MAG: hypothetical protein EBX52_08210 [Proteobacteria bacterium]|nr:hypothetical protein [Pseudomonadota bacterium]
MIAVIFLADPGFWIKAALFLGALALGLALLVAGWDFIKSHFWWICGIFVFLAILGDREKGRT